MNIVILTHEMPFPANHGGRIDVWNRILAFKAMGHKIFLVAWAVHSDNSNLDNIEYVKMIVDETVCYLRNNSIVKRFVDRFKKLIYLSVQPNIVTGCSLSKKHFEQLKIQIEGFNADFVLSDGIYAAKTGSRISKSLRLPFFIRSHNIEYNYVKKQMRSSFSLKSKLKFWGMIGNLKNYEFKTLKNADAFFDISLDDLQYWKRAGISNGYWMPPTYLNSHDQCDDNLPNDSDYDVAYVGNLHAPNNLKSIVWFLESVLPYIKASLPSVKVLIAGSRPSVKFEAYCRKFFNITFIPNPTNTYKLYQCSKTLINPILESSGVNIKTIEMLHQNKPMICTPQALSGLPGSESEMIHIESDDYLFASAIIKALKKSGPFASTDSHDSIKKYFSNEYLENSMKVITGILGKHSHA
jgi:hypothetical protein